MSKLIPLAESLGCPLPGAFIALVEVSDEKFDELSKILNERGFRFSLCGKEGESNAYEIAPISKEETEAKP